MTEVAGAPAGAAAAPSTAVGNPAQAGKAKPPWYKNKSWLVPAAVLAVVAVVVVTDLPQTSSRAAQVSNGDAVMVQVAQDIGPCSYALSESFTIYGDLTRGALTASEKAQVPALLDDDQQACSFTSSSIYDLSTIGVPGSPSGHDLGDLVETVTLWATSDALSAIEQIQSLVARPGDHRAAAALLADEKALSQDQAQAMTELHAADAVVGATFPPLHLARAPTNLVGRP